MKSSFIVILLALSICSNAQKQNNNWVFGWGQGIDFNGNTPTTFISSHKSPTSCATVSDRHTGELLFYTTGISIMDSTHTVMPNAYNIGTDSFGRAQQGTVIVPDPTDSNKYFVFFRQDATQNGDLTYSVVDMTLNGGRGDVIVNRKNILIRSGFAEGMAVTYACDGQWLILLERRTNRFFSYKINASGIDTPIISKMNYPYPLNADGTIKISPDGKRLILVSYYYDNNASSKTINGIISLNDFDMKTGVVSNSVILETIVIPKSSGKISYMYSEFSPDASKAYFERHDSNMIYQYDISLSNIAAIKSSKKAILPNYFFNSSLQMGPDSNIYTSASADIYINSISSSSLAHPLCVYTSDVIKLQTYHVIGEFPQFVLERSYGLNPMYSHKDTSICNGKTIQVKGRANNTVYQWSTGSTDSIITISQTGKYWVRSGSTIGCGETVDTFEVYVADPDVTLGNDTTICLGDELTLIPSINDSNISYLWHDNSTNSSYTTSAKGKYYVTTSIGQCVETDTIEVNVNEQYIFTIGNDTTLCLGDVYSLTPSALLDEYNWSIGSRTNTITVNKPGVYTLTGSYKGCEHEDSINIDYYSDHLIDFGGDTTLCNGTSIMLSAKSISGSIYTWQDGSNSDKWVTNISGEVWVTATNICGSVSDTIIINFEDCDCRPFVPSAFSPNRDGLNDQLKVHLSCPISSFEFKIFNRFGTKVFESTNAASSWDGTHGVSFADVGTYYYMLKVIDNNGQQFFKKGSVVLVR